MISGILIYWNKVSKDNLARQMVYEASNYINDGDYTRQGLKVITTFIDSGCLDNQTMEIFTYDVAMNYFLIQQDYNLAYRYFSHLDIDKYREIPLLMQLCDAERGFEYDEDNILKSIGRLYDIASKTTNDSRKHEMYFVVARCYERYDPNMSSGSKKAITVLEEGKRQLVADSGDMSLEEINDTKEKYDRQLETLYMKTKNRIQKNEE